MRLSFSRTSWSIMSTFVPSSNSSVIAAAFSMQIVVVCFNPSSDPTASSIRRAISVSTSSGDAPGYTAVTCTYGTSNFGRMSIPIR